MALLVSVASVLFVLTQRRDADIPAPTARLGLETEANGVGEGGSKPLFRESFASVLAPGVVERPQPAPVKADGVADRFRLVTVSLASDPQLFTDPAVRQALYFPGPTRKSSSFVISFEPGHPANTTTRRTTSAADIFRQFTAECWIRPEAESLAEGYKP